jgi:redox-sensitive bicupin YhaK (pirin superfamily)
MTDETDLDAAGRHPLEVTDGHPANVAGFPVRRALPLRQRRMVGAWCFADHLGPVPVTEEHGLDVGPHPHMGLQTVTWLIEGEALHRDSLGTEQLIRPGQLNLMTAGKGIAHAEEATGRYRGTMHGIQLWIAQPEQTRHGAPDFEHLPELASTELEGGVGTVLIGEFGHAKSKARHDTALVGVDLALVEPSTVPLVTEFEYALIVLQGVLHVEGRPLTPGQLGYLRRGREEVTIDVADPARAILIGGEPFAEQILMWWNFVGRSREEIEEANSSWHRDDGRFGTVASQLPRILTRGPFWGFGSST